MEVEIYMGFEFAHHQNIMPDSLRRQSVKILACLCYIHCKSIHRPNQADVFVLMENQAVVSQLTLQRIHIIYPQLIKKRFFVHYS